MKFLARISLLVGLIAVGILAPTLIFAQVPATIATDPGAATAQTTPVQQPAGPRTTTIQTNDTVKVGFDYGNLLAQIIGWLAVVFGPILATAGAALMVKLLRNAGVDNAAMLSSQLQQTIANGLNAGAAEAQRRTSGLTPIEIKNQAVAFAIQYTLDHRAETIKALGLDPKDGATVKAIQARIETALVDPATPTNPILQPAGVAPVVPVQRAPVADPARGQG